MKVEFTSNDNFTIYYLSKYEFHTEESIKSFFKILNYDLKRLYDYEFHGFYTVNIYYSLGLYVLEFNNIDNYESSDFDITMFLNSIILYRFYDSDIIPGEKIYYDNSYYVELDKIIEDIHLFEYGDIIYKEDVEKVLENGILINI